VTDELATALRDMADSVGPRCVDASRAIREGLRARKRRRAALGGAVAAIVAGGVAANVLIAGPDRGVAPDGSAPPTASPSVTGTPSELVSPGTTLAPDPADPLVTYWQFGYLPSDMVSQGGSWEGTAPDVGVSDASTRDGKFGYTLTAGLEPLGLTPSKREPTVVNGAVQAYFLKSYETTVGPDHPVMAELVWQRTDGYWLALSALLPDRRPGWGDEARRIAVGVIHQERRVPFPFRVAAASAQFPVNGASLDADGADIVAELRFNENRGWVHLYAFRAVQKTDVQRVKGDGTVSKCQDSNGLTLCVTMSGPPPAWLTALGGMEGLLQGITSLGTDPSGWTTQVYH
jgi:hypothetical protein